MKTFSLSIVITILLLHIGIYKGYSTTTDNERITISGSVVDKKNKPIIGSRVTLESGSADDYAVSDFDGKFTISLTPPQSTIKLEVSYIGFNTASLIFDVSELINSAGTVKVMLLEDGRKNKSRITAQDFNLTAEELYYEARRYYLGNWVDKDYKKALNLFLKAAEKGYADAESGIFSIVDLYANGSITGDYEQAIQWCLKAAEKGDEFAMFYMGLCYEKGLCVERDLSQALTWYNKAAEKDHGSAKDYAAYLVAKGVKPATLTMTALASSNKSVTTTPVTATPTTTASITTTTTRNSPPTIAMSSTTSPKPQTRYAPQKRIALIIGNGDYANGPLMNPVNDAKDMRAKLQQLGFEVMGTTNMESKGKMREQVRAFCAKAKNYDAAIFFYSGHARQDNDVNYLIPTRSDIKSEADIEDQCLSMSWVVKEMQNTGAKNVIVLLDACRNAPPIASFSRNTGYSGLASMTGNTGTLIGFATQSGQVASDGHGQRNSPYTAALLKTLDQPGLSYIDFFNRVKKLVLQATGNKQMPMVYDMLLDDFIFNTKQ